jgi:hypothetical protein
MNTINSYKKYCMLSNAIYNNIKNELYNLFYNNIKLFNIFICNGIQPQYYYIFISCLQKVFYHIMMNSDIEWVHNQARKIIFQSLPKLNRAIKYHITIFNIKELIQLIIISINYNLSNDHTILEKLGEKFFHNNFE